MSEPIETEPTDEVESGAINDAPPAAPSRMEAAADGVKRFRQLCVDVSSMLLAGGILLMAVHDLSGKKYYLQSVQIPAELVSRGYTPEVAGNRLRDEIFSVYRSASTIMPRTPFAAESGLIDFELPSAGLSYQTIIRYVRDFLRIQSHEVSAELVCDIKDCATGAVRLRVRYPQLDAVKRDVPHGLTTDVEFKADAAHVDELLRIAGRGLAKGMFPYIYASFLASFPASTDDTQTALREDEALSVIEEILKSGDRIDTIYALDLRGLLHTRRKQYDLAVRDYAAALARRPTHTLASAVHSNRGLMFLSRGNYVKAVDDHTAAITADPNFPRPYFNRALSYFNHALAYFKEREDNAAADSLGRAIADLGKAIEIEPLEARLYHLRGLAYFYGKDADFSHAAEDLDLAIQYDPSNASFYDARASALSHLSRQNEALADADRAIAIALNNAVGGPESSSDITVARMAAESTRAVAIAAARAATSSYIAAAKKYDLPMYFCHRALIYRAMKDDEAFQLDCRVAQELHRLDPVKRAECTF